MIGIVDYGSGNLRSVYNAFRFLGEEVKICEKAQDVNGTDKMVLPGVGSSRDALEGLSQRGLVEPVLDFIEKGNPFLGICLGLQLLFTRSEESGGCDCLGLVKGEVRLFPREKGVKVPQIGWNTVRFRQKKCPILKGIDDGSYFYFVHSYYCMNEEQQYTAGETEYGINYTSVLWKENIFAMQFHPERSQDNGIKLLKNFVNL